MPNFIVWYKKEFEAKDIRQAVLKEKKIKLKFHALEQVKEPKVKDGTSAIGFEYYPDE